LVEDKTVAAGARLEWTIRAAWETLQRHTEGGYVLRSNISDWSGETLWQTYIQLTQAEAAFRIQKSELSIRPIWHQKTERVQSHIFVCFLAHVLWKTLEQWQKRAGLGNSPRTLLQELARLHSADVVLPTAEARSRDITIRCVIRPEKPQAELLDRLGLRLPQRLRLPTTTPAM
jgi:transposase